MSDWGVFAVDRGIWSDPDFASEKFSEREAWMWLISGAAWKPIRVGFQGRVVPIERGEFCFSLRFLAEKFKWQKDRVDRFLSRLVKRDMLCAVNRDTAKIYKIKNYNRFQHVGIPKRDTECDTDQDTHRDSTATAPRQDRDKEETLKHSNIETPVRKKEVAAPSALPAWMPLETWTSFLGTRKKVSPHAQSLLVSELEKFREGGDDPKEVLERSIMNGWKGLFPLKKVNEHGSGRTGTQQQGRGTRAAAEHSLAAIKRTEGGDPGGGAINVAVDPRAAIATTRASGDSGGVHPRDDQTRRNLPVPDIDDGGKERSQPGVPRRFEASSALEIVHGVSAISAEYREISSDSWPIARVV